MAEPQGILRYAGIAADGDWSYMMTSRRSPSLFSANFILGANLPYRGTVTLEYNGSTVVMPDCRLKRGSIQRQGGGRWKSCLIEDWRWQWAYGYIYGAYNTFQKGIYEIDSKKSISELAQLCLNKMGASASTSNLPDIYPLVEWNGTSPAIELERLLDLVGFEIVPRWNNQIEIVKVGDGAGVNFDPRMMDITSLSEPPVIPGKLFVDSTVTLWQEDLELEPIGYEEESTEPKLIHDLLWAPVDGWESEKEPGNWAWFTNDTHRAMAKKYIYKYWRIRGPVELKKIDAGGTFEVPHGEEWRLLPLWRGQLELYKSKESDEIKPPQIIGFFAPDNTGQKNNATEQEIADYDANGWEFYEGSELELNNPEWIYKGTFSVDSERGIVMTSRPLYLNRWDAGQHNIIGTRAALLKLRIAFPVRDKVTRHKYRTDYEVNPPGGIPGIEYVMSPERLIWEQGRQQSTDRTKFNADASVLANKELAQYGDGLGYKIPAKGLLFDIQLDGKYRSIRFKGGGGGGATTYIEWGMESPEERLTSTERLRQLEIQDAIDGVRKSINNQRQFSITHERQG